jgi:hypothetical protein
MGSRIGSRVILCLLVGLCLAQRYPVFRAQADGFLMPESWAEFQPEEFLKFLKPSTRLATLTDPVPWSQDTKANRHHILGSAGRSIILNAAFTDYLRRQGLIASGFSGMTCFFVPNSPEALAGYGIRYCLSSGASEQMVQAGWIERAEKKEPGPKNARWVLYESPLPVTPFHLLRATSGHFLENYRLAGNEMEIELPPVRAACDVVATFLALPGWKAWLESRPVSIQRAENSFIRVHLEAQQGPPQPRKLVLKYAPYSNTYLLACPVISLGVAAALCWLLRLRRLRSHPASD